MFDFHPDNLRQACHERQRRIFEHAKSLKLARDIQDSQPQLHHQLFAKAGEAMIAAGTKLKERVPASNRQSLVRS